MTPRHGGCPEVVLLHGLARGPLSMTLLGRRLARAGFKVHNLRYPFRPRSIERVIEAVDEALHQRGLAGRERLSWVTYSLGGLVARAYLHDHRSEGRDRLVMLAPPNQGAQIVDTIGHLRLFRLAYGDLATQLGTANDSLPNRLAVPHAEIGVIAGNRWINPLGRWLLDSDHDGTVTVESTRLPGLADHLVLPHTHTFMMNARRVADETVHFLHHGRFSPESGSCAA